MFLEYHRNKLIGVALSLSDSFHSTPFESEHS